MSKIQWEYDLVERPFCQQLKAMGWQWIEGDKDVPEFTERKNFREVLLKGDLPLLGSDASLFLGGGCHKKCASLYLDDVRLSARRLTPAEIGAEVTTTRDGARGRRATGRSSSA